MYLSDPAVPSQKLFGSIGYWFFPTIKGWLLEMTSIFLGLAQAPAEVLEGCMTCWRSMTLLWWKSCILAKKGIGWLMFNHVQSTHRDFHGMGGVFLAYLLGGLEQLIWLSQYLFGMIIQWSNLTNSYFSGRGWNHHLAIGVFVFCIWPHTFAAWQLQKDLEMILKKSWIIKLSTWQPPKKYWDLTHQPDDNLLWLLVSLRIYELC